MIEEAPFKIIADFGKVWVHHPEIGDKLDSKARLRSRADHPAGAGQPVHKVGNPMYTAQHFARELKLILPRYKADNTWFKWHLTDDIDSIMNGWRMYRKSSQNELGFLLLGDTAIRTNKALLLNFGLTSAHGVQEPENIAMINELMDRRRSFATRTVPATELLGPGSILSDKNWSPLLNDSFVLGGVNRTQEFHLADDDFNDFHPPPTVAAPSALAQTRAVFGAAAAGYRPNALNAAEEKWKAYFRAKPTIFFESWGPRVFAREVIGMMTFGYRPVFSYYELAFDCVDQSKALSATFTGYCDALRSVRFQAGKDGRPTVMAAISTYLFGAPGILA